MNMLKVTTKRAVLLATALFIGLGTLLAQANSARISTRFANPQFNAQAKTYTLDIEMQAEGAPEQLFGLNMRFFYDASELEFVSMSELHPSYMIQGALPQAFRGNDASGSALFNFEASAAYINSAIQLTKEDAPLEISDKQWTKVGKLNFKVPELALGIERLCPSVLWDQKTSIRKEGFLPGSNGVVVTLVERDPATRETTKPARVTGTAFNWESIETEAMPFGHPVNKTCVTLGSVTSLHEVTDARGYALYQNYPNPFADNTVIEFVLPESQRARLIFSDVTGKVIHTIQGDYKAGQNAVKIERSTWPVQGAMLFYRLETTDFVSRALKMTVIDR
ncbi:MAG: hypothetical protein IPM98_00130 [Lewinellaceae bacterium]|nr:hypothetical protein [Lewinellaceae bacterium]